MILGVGRMDELKEKIRVLRSGISSEAACRHLDLRALPKRLVVVSKIISSSLLLLTRVKVLFSVLKVHDTIGHFSLS